MTWLLILAWIALLGAAAIFAQQAFGFNFDEGVKHLMALPVAEKVTALAVGAVAVFLIAASVWQSGRLAQRNKAVKDLRTDLDGLLKATTEIDQAQRGFDGAGESLEKSEPVAAISTLYERLTNSEERTAFQRSRNESVDLHQRLEEIRQRQHALRKQIGEVADKRRAIEPVFGELKERQTQLEDALANLETDDSRNSMAGRVKEVDKKVGQAQGRLKALEESWESLNRFRQELTESRTQLGRLQHPQTGLAAMIEELQSRHEELAQHLGGLETHGNDKLITRVETLAKGKLETQQRMAQLDECFGILNTIRRQFGELEEQRLHLEKALGEVETDTAGKSLADRQTELNEFAAQSRVRVRVLQDTATALNGFRHDIDRSQAALVPLRAPADGLEALIRDLHVRRDKLIDALNDIEVHGEQKLSTRVEALYRSKVETEQRIAQVVDQFSKLDTIRTEIGGLFAKLNGTLDRLR
jgi:chromosome segregation ATPase